MWTVNSLEKSLMPEKIEGRKRGIRGWDGWMASPTQWTRTWEAWRAAVYGVAKSWTRLGNWTCMTSLHMYALRWDWSSEKWTAQMPKSNFPTMMIHAVSPFQRSLRFLVVLVWESCCSEDNVRPSSAIIICYQRVCKNLNKKLPILLNNFSKGLKENSSWEKNQNKCWQLQKYM